MAVLMTTLFIRLFILLDLLIKPSNLNNGTPQTSRIVEESMESSKSKQIVR